MNRFIPAIVIVAALVVAFFLSRPQPVADPSSPVTTVQARVLTGTAFPPQPVKHLAVALLVAGIPIAESAVDNNGQYSLTLPSTIEIPLESLKNQQLVHGDGRLPESATGLDTKPIMFDDQNNNKRYDNGEPQLEATLFKPKTDQNLRSFFRYKILLLGNATRFVETQDTASGTKGYYRYNLPLEKGWNLLEGEMASNGYDIRLRSENTWDMLAALPLGGNTSPPGFTP